MVMRPTNPALGHNVQSHFMFARGFRNLNHGSFGTHPLPVRKVLRDFQDEAEASPDAYFRYASPGYLATARGAAAALLHVPTTEVVLVQNATSGVNTILRNLVYSPGDCILYFSTIYGACEKTLFSIAEGQPNMTPVKVQLSYPISDTDYLSAFEIAVADQTAKGKRIKVAVFDTISSLPGVRVPFEALTASCRAHGILSMIDGAHGIGHIPLDLGTLQPDFLVSNAHKWLLTPRGCAVLYVAQRNQHLIRTTFPTSHGYVPPPDPSSAEILNVLDRGTATDFEYLFEFMATVDSAPYYCIPAAIAFRRDVCGGEDAIMQYCSSLARQASDACAELLGTEVLENQQGTLRKGVALANVRLPLDAQQVKLGPMGGVGVCLWMQRRCSEEFNTFCALFFMNGAWWWRLSTPVYLELEDFIWGAKVLKGLCERVQAGEHLKTG